MNDFSLIGSAETNKELIFHSPAAYTNHECYWASLTSKSYVHVKAIKNIYPGKEITIFYDPNFIYII